jgi:DNA-binding NarL/FixJ family response regulator
MLVRSLELVLCDLNVFPEGIRSLIRDKTLSKPSREASHIESLATLAGATIPFVLDHIRAAQTDVPASEQNQRNHLSVHEQQVMDGLVRGLPNKLIARELNISEATVKVRVKTLLRKINASNRTQAAMWALRQPSRAA